LSTAFFTPNFLIAIAASPPEEVTLPAISAAVVMHTGHMDFPSFAGRRSQYALLSASLGLLRTCSCIETQLLFIPPCACIRRGGAT
jgi:hypothetical protein